MILLTEDQLNGLLDKQKELCWRVIDQQSILNAPYPPLPVSEDREVWAEVDSKEFAKEVEAGSELIHGVDFNDKIYWLKKVKLSSLVLNSSK